MGDDRGEPEAVSRLIEQRLARDLGLTPGDEAFRPYQEFIKRRFLWHLRNFRTFAGKYAFAFSIFSVVAITSSVATASLSAGWSDQDWAKWAIFAFGLAAAVSAAINQLWRPAQKATSRSGGARSLCDHGWAYALSAKPYPRVTTPGEAEEEFKTFAQNVGRIIAKAEAADDIQAEPAGGNGGGS